MVEARLRAEYQTKFEHAQVQARHEMEQFKIEMRREMEEMRRACVAETKPDRPRKKSRCDRPVVMPAHGKLCSICADPTTARDVHRHRELGVHLDGKCRKQVETFKGGGCIQERRKEWTAVLSAAAHSDLSRRLLISLGQNHKTLHASLTEPSCQTSLTASLTTTAESSQSLSMSSDNSQTSSPPIQPIPAPVMTQQCQDAKMNCEIDADFDLNSCGDIDADWCLASNTDLTRTLSEDLLDLAGDLVI